MSRTKDSRQSTGGSPGLIADAELGVARMRELSPDLRGCAVIGPGGDELAATGGASWADAAGALLAAAEAAGPRTVAQVHVATEGGEVFAVRNGELALVAVTERFPLASLVLFDMRTILRDVVAGNGVPDRRASPPAASAEDPR